jgi:predicted HTH domain antitoxin
MSPQTAPEVERQVLKLNRARRYSPGQIAEMAGVALPTMHAILARYGVKAFITQPPIFSADQENDIVRRYAEEESLTTIAKAHSSSRDAVRQVLKRRGIALRSRGGANNLQVTHAEFEETRRLYEDEQLALAQVGERLGLADSSVLGRLRRGGATVRTTGEGTSLSYKLGRRRPWQHQAYKVGTAEQEQDVQRLVR